MQAKGGSHHQKGGGLLVVAMRKSADDVRQNGHHEADGDHVDQDRDQDKRHGRLALVVGSAAVRL